MTRLPLSSDNFILSLVFHDHRLIKLKSEYGGNSWVNCSTSALSFQSMHLNSGNGGITLFLLSAPVPSCRVQKNCVGHFTYPVRGTGMPTYEIRKAHALRERFTYSSYVLKLPVF